MKELKDGILQFVKMSHTLIIIAAFLMQTSILHAQKIIPEIDLGINNSFVNKKLFGPENNVINYNRVGNQIGLSFFVNAFQDVPLDFGLGLLYRKNNLDVKFIEGQKLYSIIENDRYVEIPLSIRYTFINHLVVQAAVNAIFLKSYECAISAPHYNGLFFDSYNTYVFSKRTENIKNGYNANGSFLYGNRPLDISMSFKLAYIISLKKKFSPRVYFELSPLRGGRSFDTINYAGFKISENYFAIGLTISKNSLK